MSLRVIRSRPGAVVLWRDTARERLGEETESHRGEPTPPRPSRSTARAAHAASTRGPDRKSLWLDASSLQAVGVVLDESVDPLGRDRLWPLPGANRQNVRTSDARSLRGGGSHGVVARTNASANARALPVHVPARGGQPTKGRKNAGQGRGSHFQRQAQRAIPEELRKHAPGAADAEEDRVVVVLLEAIVPAGGDGGWGKLLAWHGRCSSGRALCQAWLARWRAQRE